MLTLKKELFNIMTQHAIREFPNEACGILAGRDGCVSKLYEMTNADASPSTFFMEPKEQFKVIKEIRSVRLEMIGIYHSHVASEARPSTHDVELAFYPDVSYVIISLIDKKNPGIRSFKIREGKIDEEEIKIE